MTSAHLYCFFLLVAALQFDQVIGVIFGQLRSENFNELVTKTPIHASFKRDSIKFQLDAPWLIANNGDFFVIIFSCDCTSSNQAPCNSKSFYTFIRLWRYDPSNNAFLVIEDDMGLGKPLVSIELETVKSAAETWLNAVKQDMKLSLESWKAKIGDGAIMTLQKAKEIVISAYGFLGDNAVPCAAGVFGLIYGVLMQGPGNPVHVAFTDFINNYVA